MTLIARPAPNTRRVTPGDAVRVGDQNATVNALLAVQAAVNLTKTGNARPWAEQQLYEITAIHGDYLECVRVWRGATLGSETVYVAKPALLRQSVTLRDGVSYVYTTSQSRTASKSGETDEAQFVTPTYLVGDIIEGVFGRGLTGITEVDEQRRTVIDANVDGRAWAAQASA